jgi:hypothetical protein
MRYRLFRKGIDGKYEYHSSGTARADQEELPTTILWAAGVASPGDILYTGDTYFIYGETDPPMVDVLDPMDPRVAGLYSQAVMAEREEREDGRPRYRLPRLAEINQMSSEDLTYWRARLTDLVTAVDQRVKQLGIKGLYLVSFDAKRKINVVHGLRMLLGLGLREAKAIADAVESGSPRLLSESATPESNGVAILMENAKIEWRE